MLEELLQMQVSNVGKTQGTANCQTKGCSVVKVQHQIVGMTHTWVHTCNSVYDAKYGRVCVELHGVVYFVADSEWESAQD